MQIHEEALVGKSRPYAPEDCAKCAGKQKLHKHQTYQRNANPTGEDTATMHCFRCPPCGLTISIIPAVMFDHAMLPGVPVRSPALRFTESGGSNPTSITGA